MNKFDEITDIVFDFDLTFINTHAWKWVRDNRKEGIIKYLEEDTLLTKENLIQNLLNNKLDDNFTESFGLDNKELEQFLIYLRKKEKRLHICTYNSISLTFKLLYKYNLVKYFTYISSCPVVKRTKSIWNIGDIAHIIKVKNDNSIKNFSIELELFTHSCRDKSQKIELINKYILNDNSKVLFIDDSNINYPKEDKINFVCYRYPEFKDIMSENHVENIKNGFFYKKY